MRAQAMPQVWLAVIVGLTLHSSAVRADDALTPTQLLLKGRYEEAAERLEKEADSDPAAAIGLARAQRATGQRAKAHETLEAAAARFDKSAAVRGELALLAFERGDHDAAARDAATALILDRNCVAARYAEAELHRTAGRLDEAERTYAWFIGYYNRAPRIDDPWDLVMIGRAVAQHARWTRNSNQFRRLVSDVYPALLRRESSFWPARLESALLFIEKFNAADASAELTAALTINPHAAELHAAQAALALDSFDLAAAKTSIDRAMDINAELVWGHQLRADLLLADLRPDEAMVPLETAVQLNPRDERTLGRLLAAYVVLDGRHEGKLSPRAQALVDEATQRNPHCGELFLAAADAFDRMRRFSLAAEFYRTAGERMPRLISVRGQLGLVLMRLGQETEAAPLLEESFAVDPFNVRVKNMLEVLDVLKGYAAIETEHFVIKFDRGQDELLARYAARHLEEMVFPSLTKRLGYAPPGKTLIEIFSRHGNTSGHSWFSARMVGLPFIGTVGACAGKMIAITSPGELPEKYNWAQVLGHEFVHVVNLQQTDFAVPHWLTEGLAVHLEDRPRPREWTLLLASRLQDDAHYDLDTLTLGFIRPQSSDDWTLAYAQAELYVEYLLATYGDDAISKLLAAYADRCSTPQALTRCFGVSQADFERGYAAFIQQAIASAGPMGAAAQPTLAELQRKADANPEDAEAASALALAWLERDDKPHARRWAVAAQAHKPKHQVAAYVLARLQLSIGDSEGAIKLLEASLDKQQPLEEALALLAALKLQAGDAAAAEECYMLGDQRFPHGDRWLKGLVRIALQTNDHENLAPLLRRWSELAPDNVALHKRLAQLALEQKDFPAALATATTALHLDVQDAEIHAALAAALAGQKQHAAAAEEYEVAIRLDSRQPDWYAALAAVQIEERRLADARLVVGRLRELAPKHPRLTELEKKLSP